MKPSRAPITGWNSLRLMPLKDRWSLHAYYTLCPYAPDGSNRILAAGGDLGNKIGEVFILSTEGRILDRFGSVPLESRFFHTGLWQSWSPDARFVYYQSGTAKQPQIIRRELATGEEITLEGDMEGAPPNGEPLLSGLTGMLYAAGYADGKTYSNEGAPVPFQERHRHGLFEYRFDPPKARLALGADAVLDLHPQRDMLRRADQEVRRRLGAHEGLTLLLYCVRWNSVGTRFLFYFGNHCTIAAREEPRLSYVFTASRDLREMHLALDLSFDRRGLHWSWHPDGEHLIGYGPDPANSAVMCLAQVRYDGAGYRRLSVHNSGGHPSISPADPGLLVTDTYGNPGAISFIDLATDTVRAHYELPRANGMDGPGRHPGVIDLHPVFHQDGRRILANMMMESQGILCEIEAPK